ncbi:MAG: hypothetical protein IJ191_06660 [Treponema sp.]|nr:hypothetical protein [Treponema sp.]
MRVLEIQNIFREEGHIFYLRKFTGTAVIEIPTENMVTPIEFSIETSPLGQRTIAINLLSAVNYPILPLKKAIREFILAEDMKGKLP